MGIWGINKLTLSHSGTYEISTYNTKILIGSAAEVTMVNCSFPKKNKKIFNNFDFNEIFTFYSAHF